MTAFDKKKFNKMLAKLTSRRTSKTRRSKDDNMTFWTSHERNMKVRFSLSVYPRKYVRATSSDDLFYTWVSFTFMNHRTAGEREGNSIPFYNFHPLHRHLDISRTISAEFTTAHSQ